MIKKAADPYMIAAWHTAVTLLPLRLPADAAALAHSRRARVAAAAK